MSEYHDDKEHGKVVSIKPVQLRDVEIVKTIRNIEVPNFIPVDVEVPTFIDKEYERPVPVDTPYERPVITDVQYERPVVTNTPYNVNVPVPVEKPYDVKVPVPKEVPYDLPVVNMTQLNEMALEVKATMKEAQVLLKDLSSAVSVFKDTITEVNRAIPEMIKIPKVIEEKFIVRVPELIKETVRVIGKIVVKEE